ncbi:hypothetical protein IWQ54_006585 [Labrenzia sp. EL_195]|nr:hypothetical protein [Labrenzia sp. EL_195]
MKYLAIGVTMFLASCGTYVPPLSYAVSDLIYSIEVKKNIQCEIIDAVHLAYKKADELRRIDGVDRRFFKDWGLLYSLTLNVIENSSLDPSLGLTSLPPGNVVFTLNSGLNVSAKATRVETSQDLFLVSDVAKQNRCEDRPRNKIQPIENTLGLSDWLIGRLAEVDAGLVKSIGPKESFTYKITFEIKRGVGLTPSWAFVDSNLSQTSGIFGAGRTTRHTALFTFGPVKKDASRVELTQTAFAVYSANLIGDAINQER